MSEIKEQEAPELGWESIAARVYWSTSSEQRAKERTVAKRRKAPAFAIAAVAAVGAVSLWSYTGSDEQAAAPAPDQPLALVAPAGPEAAPGTPATAPIAAAVEALSAGLVTFAQGDVRAGDQPLPFDLEIVAGTHLAAGEGGLVVQFGDRSAFRLAAHSSLEVRRFDSKRIELAVVGTVDVDITRRSPGQEFVVVAGEHEVVVRGTAFRVEFAEGKLGVSCTRGKVVVSGDEVMVPVPAGQALRIVQEGWEQASLQAKPIDPERLRALDAAMYMPMLPVWSDRQLLVKATTVLEVSAPAEQRIAIDGVAVAEGSFFLRSMSGRHQVALMDRSGQIRDKEWIDSAGGGSKSVNLAQATAPVARVISGNSREAQKLRRGQMMAGLDKAQRTDRCLASLAKQGLKDGAFAEFEVGVTADGSQDYLTLRESNLSPVVVKCLRSAIDAQILPSGPAAGFRFRLTF
jgi:hypothetical protein